MISHYFTGPFLAFSKIEFCTLQMDRISVLGALTQIWTDENGIFRPSEHYKTPFRHILFVRSLCPKTQLNTFLFSRLN